MSENHCRGTIEKPVTRSKLRRIRPYSEYFDSPACRDSCATSISVGVAANVYASAGMNVLTSRHALIMSTSERS